jgi:hypothetical protein
MNLDNPFATTSTPLVVKPHQSGQVKELRCFTKQVSAGSLVASALTTCEAGETVRLTVHSTLRVDGSRNDVGWYMATDGGDALTGQCAVHGLQSGRTYSIVDKDAGGQSAGRVKWLRADGADNDQCGDVFVDSNNVAFLSTPLLVDVELPCIDRTEDGALDVAICFTWLTDAQNLGTCSLNSNTPGSDSSCFCSTYEIENVFVEAPTAEC